MEIPGGEFVGCLSVFKGTVFPRTSKILSTDSVLFQI